MSKHHKHKHEHKHDCHPEHDLKSVCEEVPHYGKLSPLALALAAGITYGLGTLFLGWAAATHQVGIAMVQMIGSVYKGFAPTMTGTLWGGVWGFIDGFISGLVFAWLYNLCACCKLCQCKK